MLFLIHQNQVLCTIDYSGNKTKLIAAVRAIRNNFCYIDGSVTFLIKVIFPFLILFWADSTGKQNNYPDSKISIKNSKTLLGP